VYLNVTNYKKALLDSHALPRARGPKTLGKGFAEGGPRQRALGKF
jgi:hypothetical protein